MAFGSIDMNAIRKPFLSSPAQSNIDSLCSRGLPHQRFTSYRRMESALKQSSFQ